MASWTDQSASEHSWLYEAAKGDEYHPPAPSALPPPNYARQAPEPRWWAIALASLLALGAAAMILVTLSPPANAGLIACALGHVPPAHVTVCLSFHGDAFFQSSGFVGARLNCRRADAVRVQRPRARQHDGQRRGQQRCFARRWSRGGPRRARYANAAAAPARSEDRPRPGRGDCAGQPERRGRGEQGARRPECDQRRQGGHRRIRGSSRHHHLCAGHL